MLEGIEPGTIVFIDTNIFSIRFSSTESMRSLAAGS
jgi:hypothetical protein